MSLYERIKNIIRSNLNFSGEYKIDEDFEDSVLNSDDNFDKAEEFKEENNFTPKHTPTKEEEYYAILELEYGADFTKIKSSYKRLLKKYHPDLFKTNPEKEKTAVKLTKQINEAYSYFEKKFM